MPGSRFLPQNKFLTKYNGLILADEEQLSRLPPKPPPVLDSRKD